MRIGWWTYSICTPQQIILFSLHYSALDQRYRPLVLHSLNCIHRPPSVHCFSRLAFLSWIGPRFNFNPLANIIRFIPFSSFLRESLEVPNNLMLLIRTHTTKYTHPAYHSTIFSYKSPTSSLSRLLLSLLLNIKSPCCSRVIIQYTIIFIRIHAHSVFRVRLTWSCGLSSIAVDNSCWTDPKKLLPLIMDGLSIVLTPDGLWVSGVIWLMSNHSQGVKINRSFMI